MKRGTPEHPKVHQLAAALGVPKYAAVGILESLWHFAQEYAQDGAVGRYHDDAIARWIGWDGASTALVDGLVAAGWLDRCECHGLRVHDWKQHADQTVRRVLESRGQQFAACYDDASTMLAAAKLPSRAVPSRAKPSQAKPETETDTPPAPKGGALADFTAAFNAAYDRDCKAPTLNRSQEQQLKRLVANHGPKGACCLPLLAWAYDQAKGGGERVRTRAVSHLLRDGERGTFVWATLLETAPAVARCGGVVTTERRLWRVAERLGLTEALEGFGCERPQEQSAAPDRPVPTLEEVRAMRRRAEEEARQRAIAKAEAEAAPLLAARTSA